MKIKFRRSECSLHLQVFSIDKNKLDAVRVRVKPGGVAPWWLLTVSVINPAPSVLANGNKIQSQHARRGQFFPNSFCI